MEVEGRLKKDLKSITWPLFIESALFSLLGSVDTIMLGRYSDNAVAAVGVSNQIIWMLNLMFGIITAGTSILIAQYLGAKSEQKTIMQVAGISIGVNTIIGVIISLLMFFCGTGMMKLLNSPPELINLGNQYLKIVGGFIFIQAITMTFTAILKAHSLTKICMNATIIMNIVNVILNYILIFGKLGFPSMGVAGAALATTLSKVMGLIILGKSTYDLLLNKFRISMFMPFPKDHLINILKIGVPSAAEQISYNLSQLVITSFINLIGVSSMAAKSYVGTIVCFSYIFALAVGQGGSILIGNLVGNKEDNKAYKLCIYTIKKAVIVSIVMSILIAISGKGILGFLTNSQDILSIAVIVFIIEIVLEPGRCINIVGINGLRATGDVRFPVYIGIFSMWTFGVGLAYLLGIKLNLGLAGVWIAFAVDEWFRGILVLIRWKTGKWKGKGFVNN
ncbi:MATE family efflux transporter [Clostridium sp. DSM 100503]|uniref:MATE family efflux transporter n=1 Tax=Clostridium sp. DSM 100503 TaxID=2963282 RepID=UPI00214A46D9|nr:MATE family efflux transporter [Clostridium sp. DSM 100503]MCR1952318.1 MATE family efflux transporter [Clostridium sp. DSM 100503]